MRYSSLANKNCKGQMGESWVTSYKCYMCCYMIAKKTIHALLHAGEKVTRVIVTGRRKKLYAMLHAGEKVTCADWIWPQPNWNVWKHLQGHFEPIMSLCIKISQSCEATKYVIYVCLVVHQTDLHPRPERIQIKKKENDLRCSIFPKS